MFNVTFNTAGNNTDTHWNTSSADPNTGVRHPHHDSTAYSHANRTDQETRVAALVRFLLNQVASLTATQVQGANRVLMDVYNLCKDSKTRNSLVHVQIKKGIHQRGTAAHLTAEISGRYNNRAVSAVVHLNVKERLTSDGSKFAYEFQSLSTDQGNFLPPNIGPTTVRARGLSLTESDFAAHEAALENAALLAELPGI